MTDDRRYILMPGYAFRGWKYLPYAVQYLRGVKTEFFREEEWKLFSACDGRREIHWDDLSEKQREQYDRWEKYGFIRRCESGETLFPEQEYLFYPARFKEKVQWSITGCCNYRCRHCFMSAPRGVQGEPSFEQLMTMLEGFQRCGIHNLELTGGEPLIRKDFWNLVDEIHARGMAVVQLYTNGLLVTDEFLDQLEERHMRPSIQFSFDGVGHHDWMRGFPGAEKAVLSALDRCRKRRIPTSVSMVVFRENISSLRETVNLLASYGVLSMKVGNALPQGEWRDQPEHYLSQKELYEAFLDYIPHYFEDGCPLSLGLEGFFHYERGSKEISAFSEKNIPETIFHKALMCSHVRRSMYVSPKGNVLPCMSMIGGPIEEQFPNLLETPLEEILDKNSLYMDITNLRISDYMEHNPECRSCEFRTACCGGCRALAVQGIDTDYLARDPWTCAYFKDGWKEKKDRLLEAIGQGIRQETGMPVF